MSGIRESCVAASLAMLTIGQPVLGQDRLDLNEADARDAAYTIMRAAEERFDCELEEHSVREIGNEPDRRYLFYLSANGDECHEAMMFIEDMANQDAKVMFRQTEQGGEQLEQIGDPLIFDDQILIHEVNPGIQQQRP